MLSKKRKRSDENHSEDAPTSKKSQLFSGRDFRKRIQEDDAVSAIKEFVKICKSGDTQNAALEYLEAGGGALELLGLLQSDQKKNMAIVVPVFSALQFVIMCTITDAQKYRPSTEEACKHLLNYYLPTVHDMLSLNSTAKHRQIVLKLLAAMVTLSTRVAQMILSHVKIGPTLWSIFTKHTKPINKSVRTTYIHFLMAFLFDGCVPVIRTFHNIGYLSCILHGLVYDSAETVHLVLTTLQNNLLMNVAISKTSKLHTFSNPVVKSLLSLYNWKGPSKWKPTLKEQEENRTMIESGLEELHQEHEEIVVDTVHEFLQILCASHKYGIIFHDKSIGTSGKKHNELMQKVLDDLEKPWENDKTSELVLKIVTACPDLTKCVLSSVEPFLEPRVSVKWMKTIKFVKQLIKNMDPEQCLKPYVAELTTHQITNIVQTLTTPPIILRAFASGMLQHKHLVIRHESLCLLLAMLQQFNCFMIAIKEWKAIDPVALKSFNQSIIKQLPSTEVMLSLWKKLLSPPEETENDDLEPSPLVEEPSPSSHVLAIIDSLLIYNKCFPQVLDIPSSINFLADIEQILINEDDLEVIAVVQERILKLMISLDTFAFTPDKGMFGDAISRLSQLMECHSATISLRARNILCTLLINTGIFEGILNEVFVWLHCFLTVPSEHKKSVVNLLVKSIVKVSENPAKRLAGEDTKNVLESSRVEDIFNELLEDMEDEHIEDNDTPIPVSGVTLSPLLPGVLETAAAGENTAEEVKCFLCYVIIHLFHSQPSQNVLTHLIQKWSNLVPPSIVNYINEWSSDDVPKPLKKQLGSHSLESKVSKTLLTEGENNSVYEILGLNKHDVGKPSEESKDLDLENLKTKDPIHILLLYKLCVHHLVQLTLHGEFTQELRDKCKNALFSILQIISELDKKQQDDMNISLSNEFFQIINEKHLRLICLKYTLSHPVLLQKFTPMGRKKQVMERLLTELILDLVKLISISKNDVQDLFIFLNPFKQKLINCILKRLKKCQKSKMSLTNEEGIVSMIELFELDFCDISKLMDFIVKIPNEDLICKTVDSQSLSVWGNLLNHFLHRCINMHKPLKPEIVSSIVNQLTLLAKQEKLDITSLEDSFCQYLECFPHHIKHVTLKLMIALLHQEENASSARLGMLILSRKTLFIHDFISKLRQNSSLRQKAALIFPLLSTVLTSNIPVEQALLNKIYNQHEVQIHKSILKPSKAPAWLKENMTYVSYLVDKCMGAETCHKLCEDLKSKGFNLAKYEDFYLDLITCVFMKSSTNQNTDGDHITNLATILIEMLVNLSKEDEPDEKHMETLCHKLQNIVVSNVGKNIKWTEVRNNALWPKYIKISLKCGLQPAVDTDGILLETLTKLCCNYCQSNQDNEQINQIFQWTLSHSEFLNIMLGSSKKKHNLLELLLVLAEKNSSVMLSTHIPVLLSSYNATMGTADKLVLKLLQLYESKGVSLHECRPYLWGEAAVSHYSVRTDIGMSLWRQPYASQVLELLNKDQVLQTISKYPLSRGLQSSSTICDDGIYDPAFYLPLFSHLLAPESVIQAPKFVVSGGFALTIAALASTCADVRAAAYLVIARLYFHSEAIRSEKGRMLGLQFLDAIRNGISSLKNKSENPQLPSIITSFLARTSLILTETNHTMYISLQNFIIAKSSLDMNTVPEFFTFFHSSEVEYRVYRRWILQILCDGLRSEMDFQLSERCVVFKLLLGFYSSALCDADTKSQIMSVLESAVKIQTPTELLVTKNGLISWLYQAISVLGPNDIEVMHSAINVIHSMWDTFCVSSETCRKKLINSVHLPQHILQLTTKLLTRYGMNKLPVPELKKVLETINGVITFENTKAICSVINLNEDLNFIVSSAKKTLGSVLDCEDLLLYGCEFAKTIEENKSGTESDQAIFHLRSIIVKWLHKMHNGQSPQ
ncbi:hypothetical protein L9F63_020498 [Diploptera punctata]|uniref:Nucleolar pre-ribosomal-associated protein 1 n=1 Tax=Diploptera punctata TaxID=6984 RepID=A0AAD7ZSV8_DIPPU|nr:hypothetical protein L9F63_020498 [Diploptera punctata]